MVFSGNLFLRHGESLMGKLFPNSSDKMNVLQQVRTAQSKTYMRWIRPSCIPVVRVPMWLNCKKGSRVSAYGAARQPEGPSEDIVAMEWLGAQESVWGDGGRNAVRRDAWMPGNVDRVMVAWHGERIGVWDGAPRNDTA